MRFLKLAISKTVWLVVASYLLIGEENLSWLNNFKTKKQLFTYNMSASVSDEPQNSIHNIWCTWYKCKENIELIDKWKTPPIAVKMTIGAPLIWTCSITLPLLQIFSKTTSTAHTFPGSKSNLLSIENIWYDDCIVIFPKSKTVITKPEGCYYTAHVISQQHDRKYHYKAHSQNV